MKLKASPTEARGTVLPFTCNICGSQCEVAAEELQREAETCVRCGSTARWRSLVYALSVALFGEGLSIPDFPERRDIAGLGLSDDWRYSDGLASKLAYRNTFYHQEPRLDITDPPDELVGTLDFITSSDVFEHVNPPMVQTLQNCFRTLKPGGVLVLTVPDTIGDETVEHFPDLYEYEILDFQGQRIMVNRTRDGRLEVFENLKFHGGEGFALEMRVLSRPALLDELRSVGFDEIIEWTEPRPEIGVPSGVTYGFPIVARRS